MIFGNSDKSSDKQRYALLCYYYLWYVI